MASSESLESRLYPKREGEDAALEIKSLFTEPEIKLTPEELEQAREFARLLYEAKMGEQLVRQSDLNLEEVRKLNATGPIQEFYLSYFETPEGKEDLIRLGIGQAAPEQVADSLKDIDRIKLTVKEADRKDAANRSTDWYKKHIAEALTADSSLDIAQLDEEPITVNYQPDRLLNKLAHLKQHRQFYREVRRGLKQEGGTSNLDAAKMALVNIYWGRANNLIADLYPEAISLGKQLAEAKPVPHIKDWQEKLGGISAVINWASHRDRREGRQEFEEFKRRFAKRLDFLKHGASEQPQEGYTPISQELVELAREIEGDSGSEKISPALEPEIISKLQATKWDSAQTKVFCEEILASWGILSGHQADWHEVNERDGWAPDNEWQIVINQKKKDSFSVDKSKKVLFIGENFSQSLAPGVEAGVLATVAHELTHVLQAQSDEELAQQVPLAAAGGRRNGALREAGTLDEERKVYAAFGLSRHTNLHYLKALRAKLAGGNKVATARAFYDSYTEGLELDESQQAKARKRAADRGLRLFRGGGSSSKDLVYIEQELIRRELYDNLSPAAAQAVMTRGASFSISDAAELHKYGLLDLPTDMSRRPAEDVMNIFFQKFWTGIP